MISRVTKDRLRMAGMNQREFAALLGVSEGHLSLVLAGKREPSPRLLCVWEQVVEPLIRSCMEREDRCSVVAGVETGGRS